MVSTSPKEMNLQPYIYTKVTTKFRLIKPKLGVVLSLSTGTELGYFDLRVLKVELPEEIVERFGAECEDYRLGMRLTIPTLVYLASSNQFQIK
jgi:hypothetical protein